MKPPKCPVCGVSEWRHLCGNVAIAATPKGIAALAVERKPKKERKPPKNEKGFRSKGGRPKKEGALSAAERKARWKAKQK